MPHAIASQSNILVFSLCAVLNQKLRDYEQENQFLYSIKRVDRKYPKLDDTLIILCQKEALSSNFNTTKKSGRQLVLV